MLVSTILYIHPYWFQHNNFPKIYHWGVCTFLVARSGWYRATRVLPPPLILSNPAIVASRTVHVIDGESPGPSEADPLPVRPVAPAPV